MASARKPRRWPAPGTPANPRQLWAVDCGEGYAGGHSKGARLPDGLRLRQEAKRLALSFAGRRGRNLAFAYTMPVKRNHGMTRTMPAVADKYVVAMDPKCHVLCLDAATGELRWG
jgi:outer membrane protein assembly factor BamB